MTQHLSHAIDITAPLLIAASPEVANAIAPNDIVANIAIRGLLPKYRVRNCKAMETL
jgi:hypothetical protein